MSVPVRVQQRRTAGWRKPENTVSVARPSTFGNPFRVGGVYFWEASGGLIPIKVGSAEVAVSMFRSWMSHPGRPSSFRGIGEPPVVTGLAGKNLMCFCPLDHPCHADVLLELANGVGA